MPGDGSRSHTGRPRGSSVKQMLGALQDRAMFALLGRQIIYNVAWEDPRIDAELLDIQEKNEDTILMLTSGGCNVLDMLLEKPARVVACDMNPRQNALLELKVVAIKNLTHEQFFQLFAKSNYPLFNELYPTKLRPHLSDFARGFWDENAKFFKSVMWSGSSGWAAWTLLKVCRAFGLGGLIDEVRDCPTLAEQRAVYAKYEPFVASVCRFVNATKRIWCPLIAVPANQLHLFDGNIAKHAVDNLFMNTHIARDNYFYHGYMYGAYTRECCPRYLKAENFAVLRSVVDRVDIRTGTLQEVASKYPDAFFSRYILLDHMDWMPMAMVLDEWAVFATKARSDARILWRSFSPVQHIAPLKYLDHHPENVRAALLKYPDRVAMYLSTHLATIPQGCAIVPRSAYAPAASCGDDLRVLQANWVSPILRRLACKGRGGSTHQEHLDTFYAAQASSYDVFRHRFLHGRVPMIEAMPTPKGGVWLDLGGGTAANLEHLREHLHVFSRVIVLDLCRPLLAQARARVEEAGWDNVTLLEGDATSPAVPGLPKAGTVDLVTLSYSLTMIPDWRAALENAYTLLRPGGYIAVSDFTVTPEHSVFTRTFWPALLGTDGVRPNTAHLKVLRSRFREVHCTVDKGGFPYVPLLKAPYMFFIGQKPW